MSEPGPPPLAEIENGADDDRDFEDVPPDDIDDIDDDDGAGGKFRNVVTTCQNFCSKKRKQLLDKIEVFAENRWGPMEKTYIYENTSDFLYSIDVNSQKIFPLIFLILQMIYWMSYLYIL